MPDLITIVEKFIQYKELILSERFVWFSVFIILTTVAYYLKQNTPLIVFSLVSIVLFLNAIALYPWEKAYFNKTNESIDNYDYDKSKKLIENTPFLISYSSKVKYDLLKIQYYLTFESDPKNLFKSVESLQNKYLLSINDEETKFILSKINIYKRFENIKLIQELLMQIDSSKLKGSNLLSYKLAESFLLEYNGNIAQAKDLLISLLDSKDIDKVLLYNAIGRLDELQSNYKQAIIYYEKSFEYLEKTPQAKYFHTVLHNLIIVNTRVGDTNKSKEWLNIYESMIDKNNLSQYLEFLNTQLLLARQLRDRVLLLESYSNMSIFIEPKLDEDRWMAHFSSKLRMSFNDGVNFDENLISAKNLFPKIKNLEFPKNYFISKEIFYILKSLDEHGKLGPMKDFYLDLIQYLTSFVKTIHEHKKQLPDLALIEQFSWLSEENLLMKLYLSQELKKSNFENLFADIEQMKQYAVVYKNQYLTVKANMMIVDEYIAYSKGLDSKFKDDFEQKAMQALIEAEPIILENKNNPRYFEFFIPTAYYYTELYNNKDKAREYIELFESKKITVEQYAQWQRFYYDLVLKALK
jgi:hypothetical protein